MINEMFLAGLGTGTTLGGVIGVLAGRKLEWHNAYGAGRVTQKMMDDYDPGSTALGRLAPRGVVRRVSAIAGRRLHSS